MGVCAYIYIYIYTYIYIYIYRHTHSYVKKDPDQYPYPPSESVLGRVSRMERSSQEMKLDDGFRN